jgi:hypothetical protein
VKNKNKLVYSKNNFVARMLLRSKETFKEKAYSLTKHKNIFSYLDFAKQKKTLIRNK